MPGKMPLPRPTHSSKLLAKYSRASGSSSKSTFKMKKFKRVERRVNSNNNGRRGVAAPSDIPQVEPSNAEPTLVDDEIAQLLEDQ